MSNQSSFPLDQAVLGFLMQGPAHGYALHDRAEAELGPIWYMGMSNVYGTLKHLEEAGDVDSTMDEENYPPRRVYEIAPSGRERFASWVREPVAAMRDMRVEFLAKLYFFHTLTLDGLGSLLDAQREVCHYRLAELMQNGEGREPAFDGAVREFRRRRIQAALDWLSYVEQEWR